MNTFDINLTKSAITHTEGAQELNRQLARLLTDIAHGRGYMVMHGSTAVSVVPRQEGDGRLVKIYATPLLQATRHTKEEAMKRVTTLDPDSYRVVKVREALAVQGDALSAYMGTLHTFHEDSCRAVGMEVSK